MNAAIRRFVASALPLAACLPLAAALTGCSAQKAAMSPEQAPAAGPAPPVLARSLYAKDASGSLTESDLGRILESPIDLSFPARVGVVPLSGPFDAGGKVAIGTRSVAAEKLARSLLGASQFSHVSDISTDIPNPGGIEGLRVLAARYRLRYLVLYSERFEDETHLNGWAWTYPTVLGMFLAPGVTVESRGLAQADLLDVRTGTVLFSVVEPMQVSEQSWMIGAAREHRQEQGAAAAEAAERLAKRVATQANVLVAFADRAAKEGPMARSRILPAPIAEGTGGAVSPETVPPSGAVR
jgi:rhombotail lipoprotein